MIAYFHLAVQTQESLKRLNFSRDMIEGLGKNFIFLVTPFWDDRLAQGAYDFYSFVSFEFRFTVMRGREGKTVRRFWQEISIKKRSGGRRS